MCAVVLRDLYRSGKKVTVFISGQYFDRVIFPLIRRPCRNIVAYSVGEVDDVLV